MISWLRYFIYVLLCMQVVSQRPLLNHTSHNTIPTGGLQQTYNHYNGGKKLRNGRLHEVLPLSNQQPTTATTQLQRVSGLAMYDELDLEGVDVHGTRLPPLGSKRGDNRRRLNLAGFETGSTNGIGNSGNMMRGDRGNSRRGIDSLRKELMKPSVGGPGGGISGSSAGYPSYSATSSIGKIDGLGSLGSANRYGDQLRPAYSTHFPPQFVSNPQDAVDQKPMRYKKPSNPITEIMKMNNNAKAQRLPHGQADEPAGGTNNTGDDLEEDEIERGDLIQAIKEKMRSTAPKSSPYETLTESTPSSEIEDQLGVKCSFETLCAWKWSDHLVDGFQVISGAELAKKNMTGLMPGPIADSMDDANGHFLYARLLPTTAQVNLTSPQFSTTMEKCFLEVFMHQSDMNHGLSRVVVESLHSQENSWVPAEIVGDNIRQWGRKVYRLGRISQDFRIVFEIVPKLSENQRAHVAIDNLHMVNCFPEGTKSEKCSTSQVKCMMNKVPVCIPLPRICDITKDCDDAEDELLNCDKIPFGGRCDFENDWCGWRDSGKTILSWSRHTGSSPTHDTGPDGDHTFQHLLNATGGYYMLVNMNQHMNNSEKGSLIGFASNAIMISKTFNPPPIVHGNPNSPYRNSCVVRFYIHQFGKNPGSINLSVVEMKEKENITTTLWWSTKNQGGDWLRAEYVLPNITSKYYLQFEARMGMRIYSDVAVDDFSLSPECFGLNIPDKHLNGYNYWDVRFNVKSPSHRDFDNKYYLELTTCDTRGMIGPTQLQCEHFYKVNNKSHILKEVRVVEEQSNYKGMQKWKVPHEGYYTVIAKGASGGLGSGGVGSSRGAMSIAVLELHKNEELYILVGQQGENACIKSIGQREEGCGPMDQDELDLNSYSFSSKQHMVKNIYIEHGAGGGGGGSYVFLLNSARNDAVPLIVAGGGGGLGIGQYIDEDFQHGKKADLMRQGVTGQIHGDQMNKKTSGPGGGWSAKEDQFPTPTYGSALLQGGQGGYSCYIDSGSNSTTLNKHGQGGFGGGGGGCNTGGSGGGYAGGDVYLNESNGEGGTSFISTSRSLNDFGLIYEGASSGPGSVIIIPAIEGCGCDYRCIALDEFRSSVRCICPEGWRLKKDNQTACEVLIDERIPFHYLVIFFVILVLILAIALTTLIVILYNRYQRKKQAKLRHKMLLEQDLQLSRLRHNIDDSNLTNFNPNYGCDGILNGHIDVKSLPQVARESLRLVKALGQGAFGEVYQGLYRHRDGDAVEMPVAVKTLPEMSTRQAEEDFLMEAAIMAKFNHPNMVHLIGVCFDRHPRFIVLELLAGGDLKNFLREGRNKPERPSPLTMKDLVFCALDVAKGCRYMESKRFIHRDIAARNCLLSSKGPGRVVKIADFGMARDIYRSDYYRKGGKAMLPIKWMPPEAFLDGIFTSKTDVWSFGVLLWEVFSLGLMPYTGLPNPEVMQLVTNGGRLGSPPGCPSVIYKIMADCWNPTPEDRPSFSTLLERLTACTQDAEVMNAPLPSIFRPPSAERDQTIMRPPGGDDFCLPAPHSSDYLIPLPGIQNGGEYAGTISRNTVVTGSTACTPPVITSPSAPKPLSAAHDEHSGCWETSFILSNSKSDQPLLSGTNGNDCSIGAASISVNDSQLSIKGGQCGSHNTSKQHSPVQQQITVVNTPKVKTHSGTESIHTIVAKVPPEEEDAKLISLDTPQATPTTIQPPLSFASQLDGITLDPSTLSRSLNNNNKNNINTENSVNKQSYANIQVATHKMGVGNESSTEKINGFTNTICGTGINGIGTGIVTLHNGTNNGTTANGNTTPFTIQGYSDHYMDNHSEISC